MEIGMYKGYEMNSAVSIGLKKVYLGTNLKNREAPYIVVVLDGSRSFIPEEEEVYHGTDYMVMLQKFMDVCTGRQNRVGERRSGNAAPGRRCGLDGEMFCGTR